MLSTEIIEIFSNHKQFLGCFSSDNYPKSFKKNEFFIVNKDSSNEIGSHWMAVFYNTDIIEFFDSGGTNEKTVLSFLSFDKTFQCAFNETPIQPRDTNTCGEFCVFYILKRIKDSKISYKKFLNKYFNLDLSRNNLIIQKYVRSLL